MPIGHRRFTVTVSVIQEYLSLQNTPRVLVIPAESYGYWFNKYDSFNQFHFQATIPIYDLQHRYLPTYVLEIISQWW